MNLTLSVLPEQFLVHRCAPTMPIPPALLSASPVFLGRTDEELSIVCADDIAIDSERREGPWKCLKVEGPLDFALTGILAGLSGALAEAGISLFAVSTFDTDYLLVRVESLDAAVAALGEAGCAIRQG